jgi:hypothetical protein
MASLNEMPLELGFSVPLSDTLRAAVVDASVASISFALGQLPSPWPAFDAWAAAARGSSAEGGLGTRLGGGDGAADAAPETVPAYRRRARPTMGERRALAAHAQHARLHDAVAAACADPAWEVAEALVLLGPSTHTPRYALHVAFGATAATPPWAPPTADGAEWGVSDAASRAACTTPLTGPQLAAVGRRTAATLLTEGGTLLRHVPRATLPPTRLRLLLRLVMRRTSGAERERDEARQLPAGFSAVKLALRSPVDARGRMTRFTAVQMLVRQLQSGDAERGAAHSASAVWCQCNDAVQGVAPL